MPCFYPLDGYRSANGGWQSGKAHSTGLRMRVPCGRCIGCRLERSRQWAVRIMHEASLHRGNCFITLTYSDANLPDYGSLDRDAFPKFMKRLRKRLDPVKVRYFHCGEYGEELSRPHYHACIFGTDFGFDRVPWAVRNGNQSYRSPLLEESWSLGHSEIGALTFESAAYVARYCTKKVTGKMADEHYDRVDPETGEIIRLEPEYATMSRRPGIGAGWFEKYSNDVFPSDEVIVRGKAAKPPRYYFERLKSESPETALALSRARAKSRDRANETPERLQVREVCAKARVSLFKRSLENEAV